MKLIFSRGGDAKPGYWFERTCIEFNVLYLPHTEMFSKFKELLRRYDAESKSNQNPGKADGSET